MVIIAIVDECDYVEVFEFDDLEAFLEYAEHNLFNHYSFEEKEDVSHILWYHNEKETEFGGLPYVTRGLEILEKAPEKTTLFRIRAFSPFND